MFPRATRKFKWRLRYDLKILDVAKNLSGYAVFDKFFSATNNKRAIVPYLIETSIGFYSKAASLYCMMNDKNEIVLKDIKIRILATAICYL